ncbi:hypothetical protein ZIOFF_023817 [Zingiber officinale]|uniref:DUF4216 domain-containing protein n=1 Tax=Zingiber officinale TaxID=94328 RepID=A0A8J5GR96_ZINOF|nr:hypothetical protein ZIOFF_023817 [Zingiber officinale]
MTTIPPQGQAIPEEFYLDLTFLGPVAGRWKEGEAVTEDLSLKALVEELMGSRTDDMSKLMVFSREHRNDLLARGVRNVEQQQEIEFPMWFRDKVNEMRATGLCEATDELYALANRSNFSVYSYSGAIINGVKFLVEQRDVRRTTQNSDPRKRRIQVDNIFTSIYTGAEWYKNDPFVLASQAKLVYYLNDNKNGPMWKLVQAYTPRNLWDYPNIEVENDVDTTTIDAHIVQEINSRSLQLVVDLPEFENASFHRDDIESTEIINIDHLLHNIAWEDVALVEKQLIFDRLDNKFIYPKTSLVKAEVERLAMRAIRERRCKMRRHWKQLDGLQNKDVPKRKPYKGVNQDDWNFLCDYFGKKEQMEQSEKNTNNRFCRPLEGAYGSKSLVQHYHAAADTVTGELPSMIDTFEQFFHKGGQWKNDWAAQKYTTIQQYQVASLESGFDAHNI